MNLQSVYHSSLTPLTFIERNRQVYPNKTAIIYGEQRFTYSQFAARIHRLASALTKAGIEKSDGLRPTEGERVAFFCFNIPPMLEAHFAVPLAGGVLVSINTRLTSQEVAYILNDCGAKFLFVDTELADVIRPIQDSLETVKYIINIADVSGFTPVDGEDYEAFLNTGSPEPLPWVVTDELETITINYTSGTSRRISQLFRRNH
jgi:fatty-acyl-CoA synthase